jgi:hypothetical protein
MMAIVWGMTQVGAGAAVADQLPGTTVSSVTTGRVSVFSHDDATGKKVAAISILTDVAEGRLTVNPDKSFALVLTETDHIGKLAFSYQVTYEDGTTAKFTSNVNTVAGTQAAGWSLGDGYMLETGANDSVIVEHGDNHRKVYISMDDAALSLADIAAREKVSVDKITSKFLADRPEYGSSPEMALQPDAGMKLWRAITGSDSEPSSNWLLFERGHSYATGNLLDSGTAGESALHPIYVGAWGTGDKPELLDSSSLTRIGNAHIVIQDLHFSDGLRVLNGTNILFDDLLMTGGETGIQNVTNFTLRNSDFIDVIKEAPNGDHWAPHSSRISGLYIADTENITIENNFFDHSGWADDYRYDLSLAGGQPPSKYSHNVYLQYNNEDITFRDNIVMRAAGTGTQVRSGGFVEDNIFIDNNGALMVGAGGMSDDKTFGYGNYSLVSGNVITSGAHKDAAEGIGSLTAGLTNLGYGATLIDNIVTNLANPADAKELAAKPIAHDSVQSRHDTAYDDTIVHNWIGSKPLGAKSSTIVEQNTDDLSATKLDVTTIQNFAAKLLGKPTASIADLANYLRAEAEGKLNDVVDADIINAYFKVAFGLDTTIRGAETTLRFIPNELGDGVRWDNRLNWSTGDLPGVQDGDSVDLGGNWVRGSSATTRIENLDLGTGGKLTLTSGKLTVEGELVVGAKGGTLIIDNAGQFWTDGYKDTEGLTIDIDGGRFVNTGLFTGFAQIQASGDAQVILATSKSATDLRNGSILDITGANTKVGFDGDGGMALLRMHDGATLRFEAQDGRLGSIGEFRSGAFNSVDDLTSGIHLNGQLTLALSDIGSSGSKWVLASADEITGSFDRIVAQNLGTDRDIQLTIDYDADLVTLVVGAAGSGTGKVKTSIIGDEDGFASTLGGAALLQALHDSFGTITPLPVAGTTLRFSPSGLGDATRWDNASNWSTGDLPGARDDDSVNLNGHFVRGISGTATLQNLDLGEGGRLNVITGKLIIDGELAVGAKGGTLFVDKPGEIWTNGYSDSDTLTVIADGGRFVNTGLFTGMAKIRAADDGQLILATDGAAMDLRNGASLTIQGARTKVGFDGDDGTALLRMQDGATLRFDAQDGKIGTIGEFHSGVFDDDDDIISGIHLDGQLTLGLKNIGIAASKWVLASADEITGRFDNIVALGLDKIRDIKVTIDYDADLVTLLVGASGKGSGKITTSYIGDEDGFVSASGGALLWQALHDTSGTAVADPILSTLDDFQLSWMI